MKPTTLDGPVDLSDPASFEAGQPWESYRWLRENDPVRFNHEKDGPGFWAVSRYADVQVVSRDPLTYSSYAGGVLANDPSPEELAGQRYMMISMDAPDHVRYRRLVGASFMPRAARSWQPRIEALAAEIVDAVAERGECDLAVDLASPLPGLVIAELLGIPAEDSGRLTELTEMMHSSQLSSSDPARIAAQHEALHYTKALAATKRRTPGEDLASMLVQVEVNGERLTDQDLMFFFLMLVNAGGDTSRNLVGGAMEVLLRRPEQWARIVAGPEAILPTAVEELLRFVSPVIHMRRTATVDTVLGGKRIAAGDKVVMFYPSANRDEAIWPDADQLDLTRDPNPHLGFGGGGPHLCLGAHIARLEISALIGQIARRLPDLEQSGPIERLMSTFITGPRRFPIRYTPTSSPAR